MDTPISTRGERFSHSLATTRRKGRLRVASVMLATALVAGIALTASVTAYAAPRTVAQFDDNGLAQQVFTDNTTWIHGEAWVESAVDSDFDGKFDLVHLDYNVPGETASQGLRVPAIVQLSPYFANNPSAPNYSVFHELGEPPYPHVGSPSWYLNPPRNGYKETSPTVDTGYVNDWVARGFAVVHAEIIGSGHSEGCPSAGGPDEKLAGKAVIQWLTGDAKAFTSKDRSTEIKASWSTGKAALIGRSYPAMAAIAVATTGVKGLEAIVPYAGASSWYHYYRAGGTVRNPGGFAGEDLFWHSSTNYSRSDDRTVCLPVFEDLDAKQDRVTGDYNKTWDERNYLNDVDKIKAAVLLVQGFGDWNVKPSTSVKFLEALQANNKDYRVYFHQGGHLTTGPTDDDLNAFFSHYLYGTKSAGSERKAVVANSKLSGTTAGNQVYETFPDWPIPGSADVKLNLVAASDLGDGSLTFSKIGSTAPQTFVDDTTTTATTGSTVVDGVRYIGSGTNADLVFVNTDPTAEVADNRLIYTSETLTQDVRLSGTPRLTLQAAVKNKTKATLTGILAYISPEGAARVVSRGWIDVENRNSISVTDPITEGEFYKFGIELEPQDWILQKGGQIALVIISSDPGYTIRPAPGTEIAVHPSLTSLTIPVVGGAEKLHAALGFYSDVANLSATSEQTLVKAGEPLAIDIEAFTTWAENLGDVSELVSFQSTVASDTFENGVFLATEPGIRTITLSLGSASTHLFLTVEPNPDASVTPVKVKLSQSQLRLVKKKSLTLTAGVYFADDHVEHANHVVWTSSNPKVAKVSATGKVTAKKKGSAIITATTLTTGLDGNPLTTSVKVTVAKKAKVKKASANVPKALRVGESVHIDGKYSPAKATGIRVSYSSSKTSVLTIDKTGRLKAIAAGVANVKIKAGGKTKSYKVTVS